MPATSVADTGSALCQRGLHGVLPRQVFGQEGVQDRDKASAPRWIVGVAVSYHPDPATGAASPAEVLSVTVASHREESETRRGLRYAASGVGSGAG